MNHNSTNGLGEEAQYHGLSGHLTSVKEKAPGFLLLMKATPPVMLFKIICII